MKVRIAALVLTGVLCAAAPAWSDTIVGHSRDFAMVTMDSGEFDLHNAQPLALLISSFVESGKSETLDRQPEHSLWKGHDRHDFGSGDPPSTTPVAAPEPSTLSMLALGLVGLLGSALVASRPTRSGML
jgi:PEP-CTERM motif